MRRKDIPGSEEQLLLVDLNIRSVVGILPSHAALDPVWHRILEQHGNEEDAAKAYILYYLRIPHILHEMPGTTGPAMVISVSFPEPVDVTPKAPEPEYPRWQEFNYQVVDSQSGHVLRTGSIPMRLYCAPSDFHYFTAQKWITDNLLLKGMDPVRIPLTLGRVLTDDEAEAFLLKEA